LVLLRRMVCFRPWKSPCAPEEELEARLRPEHVMNWLTGGWVVDVQRCSKCHSSQENCPASFNFAENSGAMCHFPGCTEHVDGAARKQFVERQPGSYTHFEA